MIHLPKRSVTRFFIPLIDVLLLLFCIFLLMPMVAEEGALFEEEKRKTAHELLTLRVEQLEKELKERDELIKTKGLDDIAELQKELQRLQNLLATSVQDRLFMRIIDIHPATGAVSYYDPTRTVKDKVFPIADRKAAEYLIDKHRRQAGKRELYYFFYAPGDTGFPTIAQKRELQTWFEGVPHSLVD